MTSTLCPTCSCRIPAYAPEGLCPRCLVSAGLVGSLGTQSGSALASSGGSDLLSVEELGELLPHREIEALIGRGGMGTVYRAHDPRLGRRLAIKVLNGELAADPAFVERFAREARAVARLEHPNIVQIHQFVDDPDLPYLELEFVPGQSLRELLASGPLRLDRGREILRQVAAGLGYAHREGVVHRDVKPENVLVDEEGRVRLVDFGLAKITKGRTPGSLTLTGARQVVGTIHYMAPEQLEAPETVDARSDVYSWGVIAYEVLTGRLPLGRFGPPSRYAEVGPELDAIVLKALEREPEDRFADGAELRARLEGVAGGVVEARLEGLAGEVREAPRASSTPVAWGLIALALVVALGVFVVAMVILLVFLLEPRAPLDRVEPPQPARPAPTRGSQTGSEDEPGQEEARLRALEAGARLQSRIGSSQAEVRASANRLAYLDVAGAYASADQAVRILAPGGEDLAVLAAGPADSQGAVKKARESLREAREAALCARIQAAVLGPNRSRVERAQADLASLLKDRRRQDSSGRVLHAAGALHLLLGSLGFAEEDFSTWRKLHPEQPAAALGHAEVLLELERPREAAKLLESAWTDSQSALAPRLQRLGLEAALATESSEDRERWLGRLPTTSLAPYASLLRARVKSSSGDLFGALDELRRVFARVSKAPAARAKAHRLAAEIFLTHELPDEVRAQVELLRKLPGTGVPADLLEGLAAASEAELSAAQGKLEQVVEQAAPWEWRERASALRALARLSFEANDLDTALGFAKRAHALNPASQESLACLVRIQIDPQFEGKHLDAARALCLEAQQVGESATLTGLRAWLLAQQFPTDPGRSQRVARSVPALVATPLLLDLRARGSEHRPAEASRLWRAEAQGLSGRASALGQGFEFQASEARSKAEAEAAWARARLAYRRAIWHYPFHLRARLGLARIALSEGQPREAVAQAKLAFSQHPKVPAAAAGAALLIGHAEGGELNHAWAATPKELEAAPAFLAATMVSLLNNDRPGSPEDQISQIEVYFADVSTSRLLDPSSREALEGKTLALRRLAEKFEPRHQEAAARARARAKELEREFAQGRGQRAQRLKALLDGASRDMSNRDLEGALAQARQACTLAPDEGAVWAAYADLCLRGRQPREALRASACAAWASDRFLSVFMMCFQVGEQVQKGPFTDSPAAPRDPGLATFLATLNLTLSGASSPKVQLQLDRLDQLYPTKLVISALQGGYAAERGKFQAAMIPLHYAARVRPDEAPLRYYAGLAAAGLKDASSQLYGRTLAIQNLRRAKALGLTWKEELVPAELRRSPAWAWIDRPYDPSK